jgi:thiol:disulfide interchange protein
MARTEWDRSSQRWIPLWLPIVAAALIVARIISSHWDVKSKIDLVRWVPARNAESLAAAMHKPIFYEFSADWCMPCHMLEDDVFHDQRLARMINDRFVPVRLIDTRRERGSNPPDVARLQQRFRVNGFPTVVVVRAGAEPQKIFGYPGRAQFERFLNGIH